MDQFVYWLISTGVFMFPKFWNFDKFNFVFLDYESHKIMGWFNDEIFFVYYCDGMICLALLRHFWQGTSVSVSGEFSDWHRAMKELSML